MPKIYAYTTVEGPDGEKYHRGAQLPGELPGLSELVDAGSAGPEVPANDPADPLYNQALHGTPDVEVRDVSASDAGGSTEASA